MNFVKFNFVEKGGQPGKGGPDDECLWMEDVLNDESENIFFSQLLDIPTQQLILEEVQHNNYNSYGTDSYKLSLFPNPVISAPVSYGTVR